ncbi:U-box domain-containing protein 27-like [Canna indica]|uniref:U-box domain-containing protein 27-like n=1 Tax=Canna indica TaxID=4628 RepID=A0AAQ3KNB9_9LILI|nr:U-box domain-containing protein 27-like [Canna indica]
MSESIAAAGKHAKVGTGASDGAGEENDLDEIDLINACDCAFFLVSLLLRKDPKLDSLAAVARVFALILTSDIIEGSNKKIVLKGLRSERNRAIFALIQVLKDGSSLESQIVAARVLDAIIVASDAEGKILIVDKGDLIKELVQLIGPTDEKGTTMDPRAIEAAPLWFFALPPGSVHTLQELSKMFINQFSLSRIYSKTEDFPHYNKQGLNEPLMEYMKRFDVIAMEIPNIDPRIEMYSIKHNLKPE